MKRICVFCGSNSGKGPGFLSAAQKLGKLLAEKNYGLVYGGGNVGLMGEIANTMLKYNGEVIGVIPENLVNREAALKEVTQLVIVNSMHERKAMMMDLSDGFIAMPGGIGTLEEFFEVWTWAQLGIHSKPVGLLNSHDYYTPLTDFLNHSVDCEFIKDDVLKMIIIEDDPSVLIEKMENYKPLPVTRWIDRHQT